MPGINGWVSQLPAGDLTTMTARAMDGRLTSFGSHESEVKYGGTRLHTRSTSTADSTARENDILASFIGNPYWSDSQLDQYARTKGFAGSLIHAYREFGSTLPGKLKGRYVIAIAEPEKQKCLLATDRMGTLPVYYTVNEDGAFVFASSIAPLLCFPGVRQSISNQSLFDYCYYHIIPSPDTIYRNIHKLEPACLVRFRNGSIDREYYWSPAFKTDDSASIDELSEQLRERLTSAISRTANGNPGSFLSGGLDSSTVTGILSELNSKDTHAYSIGFSQEGYDEMAFARIAARHFNVELHEYYVTPDDIVEAIPLIASAYDEPFGNSSAIPALFCARMAKQNGCDLLLAGDGGDELFAGNERYAKQKIFDIYHHIPAALRTFLLEPLFVTLPLSKLTPPSRKIRSYIEQARQDMPARLESYNFMKRTRLEEIFAPEFLDTVDPQYPDRMRAETWDRADTDSLVNRMLCLDWKVTLADNDLCKVNRMCDLAGINVEYPMLDDELVEFSTSIPEKMKLRGQHLRHFYKHAYGDFLPDEIINKSKHGFGLPFGEWLKASPALKDLVYANLESMKSRGIFRNGFIDTLVAAHQGGHAAYYGSMVWVIAILEQWFREHNTG